MKLQYTKPTLNLSLGAGLKSKSLGTSLKSHLCDESGIYIATVAAFLVGLIFLVSYGLESGYLYLAQIRLQRSLDAAVTSAAYHYYALRSENQKSLSEIRDEVATGVLDHLRSNSLMLGFKGEEVLNDVSRTICADEGSTGGVKTISLSTNNSTTGGPLHSGQLQMKNVNLSICDTISLSSELKVSPLILGAFPGLDNTLVVSASSAATINTASIVASLDASMSMSLLANEEAHQTGKCDTPDGSDFYQLNCGTKFQALQYSTKAFIDRLMPGDNLSIISFGGSGHIATGMREVTANPTTGSELTDKDCQDIPSTQAWPKDCFKHEVDKLHSMPITANRDDRVTNLFDGIRMARQQLPPGSDSTTPSGPGISSYTTANTDKSVILLVSDGAPWKYRLLSDWRNYYPADEAEGRYEEFFEWSSVDESGKPNIERPNWYDGLPIEDLKRMYHSAINMADAARRHEDAYVYVVGVGTEAPLEPFVSKGDPYQDETLKTTWGYSKQILLHRLANDSEIPLQDHWPEFSGSSPTLGQKMSSQTYQQIASLPHGKYIHAETGADLMPVFQNILVQFRARLSR